MADVIVILSVLYVAPCDIFGLADVYVSIGEPQYVYAAAVPLAVDPGYRGALLDVAGSGEVVVRLEEGVQFLHGMFFKWRLSFCGSLSTD